MRSEIDENEIEIPKEGYISSEKRVQIIDELELVQKNNNGISKNNKIVSQFTKSTV